MIHLPHTIVAVIKQKADSQGIVMFQDLVSGNENSGIVENFLAVLYLMTKGKLHAYQTEFFGDIFIQLVNEGTVIIEPQENADAN